MKFIPRNALGRRIPDIIALDKHFSAMYRSAVTLGAWKILEGDFLGVLSALLFSLGILSVAKV